MMVERVARPPRTVSLVLAVGLGAVALYAMLLLRLMQTSSYDTWGALVFGPGLFLLTLPLIAREAARDGDKRLFWLLALGLALKLFGAMVRNYVATDLYGDVADARGYHTGGAMLAEQFRHLNFNTGLRSFTDTDFIKLLTGIIYTFTGATRLGGFLIYSWMAWLGMFLFYRAFRIAVPTGNKWIYAGLLFLAPSMLYWPSSIGKDAWMVFSIGIAAYGAAMILTGKTWRGSPITVLGLWFAAIVRPHVAGLVALVLGVAFVLRKTNPALRQLAPLVKAVAITGLAALAIVLASQASAFLSSSGISTEDTGSALADVASRTQTGGSAFSPVVVKGPQDFPLAAATVLFRPHILEAHNAQTLATALEASFLLLLAVVRFGSVLRSVRRMRALPYIAFCLGFVAVFIVAFSSVANFAILARERTQMYPFFFVLLALPRPVKDAPADGAA